jgi:tRNA threonylcarbamoyladenosine biosynthesis protein TsaB
MHIISIRTDKPEAELGLYEDQDQLNYVVWQAHRELSQTIHIKLIGLLKQKDLDLHDIEGIVVFKGPGSFTGLRIGISVANALAYSLKIPIVSSLGADDWIESGVKRLMAQDSEKIVVPEYGAEPHITTPKK